MLSLVWTCDITSRSYFGKMNSTLGSVVPLAMFVFLAFCLSVIVCHSSSSVYFGSSHVIGGCPSFSRVILLFSWRCRAIRAGWDWMGQTMTWKDNQFHKGRICNCWHEAGIWQRGTRYIHHKGAYWWTPPPKRAPGAGCWVSAAGALNLGGMEGKVEVEVEAAGFPVP